jgi:hypothetical protein
MFEYTKTQAVEKMEIPVSSQAELKSIGRSRRNTKVMHLVG